MKGVSADCAIDKYAMIHTKTNEHSYDATSPGLTVPRKIDSLSDVYVPEVHCSEEPIETFKNVYGNTNTTMAAFRRAPDGLCGTLRVLRQLGEPSAQWFLVGVRPAHTYGVILQSVV